MHRTLRQAVAILQLPQRKLYSTTSRKNGTVWPKEKKMSVDDFVQELVNMENKKNPPTYTFFLGAGCSISSGIPPCSELVKRWRLDRDCTGSETYTYSDAVGKFFNNSSTTVDKEFQRLCGHRKPNVGYLNLASFIQRVNPRANIIITTNFDDLISRAIIEVSPLAHPKTIHSVELTKLILHDAALAIPFIFKLHRDIWFQTINTERVMLDQLEGKVLEDFTDWLTTALAKISEKEAPKILIFAGYSGDDITIEHLNPDKLPFTKVYWVNRYPPKNLAFSQRLASSNRTWWVNSDGNDPASPIDWDKLMEKIQVAFDLSEHHPRSWDNIETHIFHQFQDLIWSDFIRDRQEVIVYLDYGKSWLLDMLPDLQNVIKAGGKVKLILADPDNALQRLVVYDRLKRRKEWTEETDAEKAMRSCLKIAQSLTGATIMLCPLHMSYALVKVDNYALYYPYQLSPEKGKPINSPVYYWNLNLRQNRALKDFVARELKVAEDNSYAPKG